MTALVVVLACMALLFALGTAAGRILRRVSEHYPEVNDNEAGATSSEAAPTSPTRGL